MLNRHQPPARRRFGCVALVLLLVLFLVFWNWTPEVETTVHIVNDYSDSKTLPKQVTPTRPPFTLPATNKYQHAVHVFYYPWYGNPETDAVLGWNHWNHRILPHWNQNIKVQYPYDIQYAPPDDIGSSFYPSRGPYSSADVKLLEEHMKELKDYTVVVSWWGQASKESSKDGEGHPTDTLTPMILDAAQKFGSKIAFHLEPYEGRSALSVKEDLEYIHEQYYSHPALYKNRKSNLPVVYVYDSYLIQVEQWRKILKKDGKQTIRGTDADAIFFGLCLELKDLQQIANSGFDGIYTYFAADGFTAASTSKNWKQLTDQAKKLGLLVSISVGPGYDDLRIRPWNEKNLKSRDGGKYYENQWANAVAALPHVVSITSYNEWMEGTQIESATPKSIASTIFNNKPYTYRDYSPLDETHYMNRTLHWSDKFGVLKNFDSMWKGNTVRNIQKEEEEDEGYGEKEVEMEKE